MESVTLWRYHHVETSTLWRYDHMENILTFSSSSDLYTLTLSSYRDLNTMKIWSCVELWGSVHVETSTLWNYDQVNSITLTLSSFRNLDTFYHHFKTTTLTSYRDLKTDVIIIWWPRYSDVTSLLRPWHSIVFISWRHRHWLYLYMETSTPRCNHLVETSSPWQNHHMATPTHWRYDSVCSPTLMSLSC